MIFVDAIGVNPDIENSSILLSKSVEHLTICSVIDSETILTTNSFVSLILINVSFSEPSHPLLAGANIIVGGLEHTPLKYEKGAMLFCLFFDIVDTNAIGLGTIEPIISLCISWNAVLSGSIITV